MFLTVSLAYLAIGLCLGWSVDRVLPQNGFGRSIEMCLGALGSLSGAWLFMALSATEHNWIGGLLVAFFGALLLLALASLNKRSSIS